MTNCCENEFNSVLNCSKTFGYQQFLKVSCNITDLYHNDACAPHVAPKQSLVMWPRVGFVSPKYSNFAYYPVHQNENELHPKRWFFYLHHRVVPRWPNKSQCCLNLNRFIPFSGKYNEFCESKEWNRYCQIRNNRWSKFKIYST